LVLHDLGKVKVGHGIQPSIMDNSQRIDKVLNIALEHLILLT
jgi:hypothetical protein